MKLSVVVPVYNEAENVGALHKEIVTALKRLKHTTFEVIFVNDGSTDATAQALEKLSPITVITFRKNFGQTAALDAGIKHATGDVVIAMDGDGQNDPADIPLLIEKINDGFDIVSGWRYARKDSPAKRFVSRGANLLRRYFIDDKIHDSGCTFKAYRRECFEHVDLYGEMHRFIPGILKLQGFTIAEVKVNHRPRRFGKTKYNMKRTLKGFLDMFSIWFWRKYSTRPLHLIGGLGFVLAFAGVAVVATLFVLRLLERISLANSVWPLAGFFLILMGGQMVVFGLLADVMIKSYYRIHRETPYNIKSVATR